MQIIFEYLHHNDLIVYIHMHTAVDNDIIHERLHRHSEYDTDWSNKLEEWKQAKYYKYCNYEYMRGHETCMTIIKFIEATDVADFIIKLNTYLEHGNDSKVDSGVYMVDYERLHIGESLK